MPEAEEFVTIVARFATVLASLDDEDSLPHRLCRAGAVVLDADGAAITLNYQGDSRLTVSTSDEMAATLEDLQDVVGQGPGFEAAQSGAVVTWRVGSEEDRWPLLASNIARVGFDGAVVAIPLATDGHPLGVLTAHGAVDAELDPDVARFLSATMGAALLADPELGHQSGHEFDASWTDRSIVHQATGMVVAQAGVRPGDALALLKGQAFARGISLLDVANDILARRINFRHMTIEGD